MLSFVPVTLDLYRPLKPRLRWAMACLVSFADRAGRCLPSVRTFALHAGISKSAAQRDLAELEAGTRHPQAPPWRRLCLPDRPPVPAAMGPRKLSQARDRKPRGARARRADRPPRSVPEPGRKKNQIRKTKDGRASARDLDQEPETADCPT